MKKSTPYLNRGSIFARNSPTNQRGILRQLAEGTIVLIVAPMLLVLSAEVALRVFWTNPYLLHNDHPHYTRLYPAKFSGHARADGLYAGGGRVRFAVDESHAIGNGRPESKQCLALGGSTTESGLIPEAERWPNLLHPAAANYGVSENTTIDSIHNLRYLLAQRDTYAPCVLIMHATNDLRAFLLHGPEKFTLEAWRLPPINLLAEEGEFLLPGGLRVRDSALTSFLFYHQREWQGRSFYPIYLAQRRAQDILPPLDEAGFVRTLNQLRGGFLPRRDTALRNLHELVTSHAGRLYLLTQPHAFRENYRPYNDDLRLYPVVDGKRTNLAQAARLMSVLNEQTRRLARELNLPLIDIDACLANRDPGPLFYDSVHYSVDGSRAVAECIQGELDALAHLK